MNESILLQGLINYYYNLLTVDHVSLNIGEDMYLRLWRLTVYAKQQLLELNVMSTRSLREYLKELKELGD